jgi:adenylate cyclase
VKVQQVSEELGVRYVLEGSVRKAEDRVRITAQLIDATTGHHLRSERYDRELKDIFAIQDEVTIKIITSLQVELTEGEQACLFAKDTDNLTAYLNYLRGKGHFYRQTGEGMISARRFFKEAITLDPEFPRPYGLLASTHMMDVILGTTKSTRQSMKRAVQLAQKAISLDDSFAPSHAVLGFAYTMLRQHDLGIAEGRRSVALDPNGATSHGLLSNTLSFSGRCDEAVQMAEKAIRLNPLPSARNFRDLAWAYVCAGRYEEAIET